jgi:hypothetical protein
MWGLMLSWAMALLTVMLWPLVARWPTATVHSVAMGWERLPEMAWPTVPSVLALRPRRHWQGL